MTNMCCCGCGKELKGKTTKFAPGHATKFLDTRLKMKATCLKNFGVEVPYKSKEIREKGKLTCLENNGVENPSMSVKIQKKKVNTFLTKYGVESSNQIREVKDKKKNTLMKNFGVDIPYRSKEIREKGKATCLENNGVEIPLKSKEIQNRSKQSCLQKFGVDNFSKTFEFRQFARERLIIDVENGLKNNEFFSPRIGKQETQILNEFELLTSFKLPIRGKNLISYFPDSRNDEQKVIVEIYEPWHKRECWIKHDNIRQKDLESLGYKYFIIWQDEWKENKNNIIDQFKRMVYS